MLVNRTIGDIEVLVETTKGNQIFFPKEIAKELQDKKISFTQLTNYLYDKDHIFRPYAVLWELLNQCNYHCPFCFIHFEENSINYLSKIWRWPAVKQDVDFLISAGMITCTLTGGEPLLHPDFPVLYRYLKEHGVIVRVFSNLSLLTEELISLFCELPPFKLEVSLYGDTNESYRNTTQQDYCTLDRIQENILKLKKSGVNVICKTAMNTLTYPSWKGMQNWCKANSVPYYFSLDLQKKYNGEETGRFALGQNEKYEVFRELYFSSALANNPFTQKECFSCDAGKTGCMISYDYCVRPCMSMFGVDAFVFQANYGLLNLSIDKMVKAVERNRGGALSFCKGCFVGSACKLCTAHELKGQKNIEEQCHEIQSLFLRLTKEKANNQLD